MKKYLYLALAAVLSVAIASCDHENGGNKKGVDHTITIGEVTATSADITVTPKDNAAPYIWSILDKAAVDENLGTDYDSIGTYLCDTYAEQYEEFLGEYGADGLAQYGITSVATMMEYFGVLVSGVDNYTYEDLTPETEYLVFAFSYDSVNNAPCSKVATATFTTPAVPRSTNKLAIAVDPRTYVATVTTTNNDPYVFYCETTSEYLKYEPDYSAASLAESLEAWVYTYAMYGYSLDVLEGFMYFTGNQTIDLATEWMVAVDQQGNASPAYGEYVAYAAPFVAGVNGDPVNAMITYTAGAAVAPANAPAFRVAEKKVADNKIAALPMVRRELAIK